MLVNQQALNDIKARRNSAVATDSFSSGYHRAMRALEMAIGMLDQLSMIDAKLKVVVE